MATKIDARVWTRRRACAALAMAPWALRPARAEDDWPAGRPIKLIVPASAGSAPDALGRDAADALSARLGQAVAVANMPGASGIIAMRALAASPPDGYALGYGSVATLAINPSLFAHLPYDPRAFAPIAALASSPNVLAVRADLPAGSPAALADFARRAGEPLSMGSAGVGTTSHLYGAMLARALGFAATHVPYKSAAQAMSDLAGGHLDFMVENISAVLPGAASGRVRALAATGSERAPALPEVPTLAELGLLGFEASAWGALIGPPGLPRPIAERVARELGAHLALPETRRAYAAQGSSPIGGGPRDLELLIERESRRWAAAVGELGVVPDEAG